MMEDKATFANVTMSNAYSIWVGNSQQTFLTIDVDGTMTGSVNEALSFLKRTEPNSFGLGLLRAIKKLQDENNQARNALEELLSAYEDSGVQWCQRAEAKANAVLGRKSGRDDQSDDEETPDLDLQVGRDK